MFDNPKKELERLEQQLLAVASSAEEPALAEFEDESFFDELSAEADDINTIYDDLSFSRRSAGFDVRGASSAMDTNRYVAVPKKKRKGGWLLIACLAVALIAWRMGWFA